MNTEGLMSVAHEALVTVTMEESISMVSQSAIMARRTADILVNAVDIMSKITEEVRLLTEVFGSTSEWVDDLLESNY